MSYTTTYTYIDTHHILTDICTMTNTSSHKSTHAKKQRHIHIDTHHMPQRAMQNGTRPCSQQASRARTTKRVATYICPPTQAPVPSSQSLTPCSGWDNGAKAMLKLYCSELLLSSAVARELTPGMNVVGFNLLALLRASACDMLVMGHSPELMDALAAAGTLPKSSPL